MEVAIVFMFLFAVIFGIFYLFYTTRNKERLALIEKGADATIFTKGSKKGSLLTGRVIILNLSLLLMGIGLGIFIGAILNNILQIENGVAYPASIFFTAGLGLYLGFHLTNKLDKK